MGSDVEIKHSCRNAQTIIYDRKQSQSLCDVFDVGDACGKHQAALVSAANEEPFDKRSKLSKGHR